MVEVNGRRLVKNNDNVRELLNKTFSFFKIFRISLILIIGLRARINGIESKCS